MKKTAVQKGLMVISALVALGRPEMLTAGPSVGRGTLGTAIEGGCDLLPLALSTYSSKDAAWDDAPTIREKSAGEGLSIQTAVSATPRLLSSEGGEDSRRRYLPVLFSLLIPGAGEISMGYYVRGAALLTAEVTAWTGYVHYHNKGLDSREAFERFADAHWVYDRWIDSHPATADLEPPDRTFAALDSIGRNHWDGWPPYHGWHSKKEEKQNYYENIGKYDWFISGWEDWDPATRPRNTDLRDTYRSMRRTSNNELDRANKFIYLSITARVVSLVETFLLCRGKGPESPSEGSAPGFSIDARATGFASGEVAVVYRFW